MKTLLVGATGLLGPEICQRLTAAGRHVRALVRPMAAAGKRAALQAMGVALVEGDLKDVASLARACAGIQAVISTASSTLSRQAGDSIETFDHDGQLALVDAARQAGVDRFVFVSFRENPQIQFPLTAAKRAVEQALKTSGMAFTIIQVIVKRLEDRHRLQLLAEVNKSMKLVAHDANGYRLEVKELEDFERPPMIALPEYRERFAPAPPTGALAGIK